MRKVLAILALLVCLVAVLVNPTPAQGSRGIPGSPEFGYGARLELEGAYFENALEETGNLKLDWLAITVQWSAFGSKPVGTPIWRKLDQAIQVANDSHLAVLVSITDAPAAALTSHGPDPAATARFVLTLVKRYPALQAVELFPAANTRSGWGAQPEPEYYARLYRAVATALQSEGSPVLLIAAGLKPVRVPPGQGEMDDLVFLRGLYRADARLSLPVISLVLDQPTGDPLSPPDSSERRLLRHYEEVRAVMSAASRENDLLWITAFAAPSGTIGISSQGNKAALNNQANWLARAYSQLRSQLSIGVTFYQSLNPSSRSSTNQALIQTDGSYHPFYAVLRELIAQNAPGKDLPKNGRPKNEALEKHRPSV